VEIFPSYLREQLLERVFLSFNGCGYDLPFGNRQVQHGAFLDFGVFSERLGNPDSQAVSPLLDSHVHRVTSPVSTMKIQSRKTGVKGASAAIAR
jgi:hypothetical protein